MRHVRLLGAKLLDTADTALGRVAKLDNVDRSGSGRGDTGDTCGGPAPQRSDGLSLKLTLANMKHFSLPVCIIRVLRLQFTKAQVTV